MNVPPANPIAILLRPAMVLRAISQDWFLSYEWWSGLIGEEWAERSLVRMLDRMKPVLPHTAQRLWQSLVDWQRAVHVGRINGIVQGKDLLLPSCRAEAQNYSPVMNWVAKKLSNAQVWAGLDEVGRRFVEEHPQWLLTHHKMEILKAMATQPRPELATYQVWKYFSAFVPDAAEGLRYFLNDRVLGHEAARGMWSWAHKLALSILRREIEVEATAVSALLIACPTEHIAVALQALRLRPELLTQNESNWWVQNHLPSSGPLARDLLALLKQA